MTKFFLFNKEPVNSGSSIESDSGVGISMIALQAQSLSYVAASKGKITFVFNNSGIYDFANMPEGEAFRKTTIDVACDIGSEQSLIQDILNFISNSSSNKTVMNFVYTGSSSFRQAEVTNTKTIESKVFTSPELMRPRQLLLSETGLTAYDIDGIEFSEATYPILDYSPAGMTGTTGITATTAGAGLTYTFSPGNWTNNSLLPNNVGPTGYDLSPYLVSFPPLLVYPGVKSSTGVGTTGMFFSMSRFMQIPNASKLQLESEYTTYISFGVPDDTTAIDSISSGALSRENYKSFGSFYGTYDGSFAGFLSTDISTFGLRHAGLNGGPAKTRTDNEAEGTASYVAPDNRGKGIQQTCYVFVIRRDRAFNVFVHDYEGDIIAVIPAKTGVIASESGRTDGLFEFLSLGYGEADPTKTSYSDAFWGVMTRFGVIGRDIGPSEASRLAKALYERYKPIK